MMELTEQAQAALVDAKRLAKRLGDNYIGTEHLLVALVRQEDSLAAKVLQGLGVSEKNLIDLIEELISPEGGIAVAEWDGNTPKLDQMLAQAEQEAIACGMDEIGTEHLLLAMVRMQDTAGARILASMSVDTQKLFAELISAMGREGITYRENNANKRRKRGAGETSTLDQYARDLTDMARQGKLDPVVGREGEIQRVIQILSRRGKNNPCLIGEPGVGKTAIVEGLAQRIPVRHGAGFCGR